MSLRRTALSLLACLALSGAALADDTNAENKAARNPAGQSQQMYGAIPPLYYNYYHPGQPTGQIPARMYLSPIPVPEYVGYTYITYNPFAPQELMHQHARHYVRYHANGGQTNTRVRWDYYDPRPVVMRPYYSVWHFLNSR